MKIEAHMNRVGDETEAVYDAKFFNELTGVANALDNVEASLWGGGGFFGFYYFCLIQKYVDNF